MGGIDDRRNIDGGWEIPTEGYCDQPYVVKTDDGAWLCVVTTGPAREGEPGQHVVTARSTDLGRTWTDQADVEPADGPESSYAVLLKAPSGRIYCLYNHNSDNVRRVRADDPPFAGGWCRRVDSLGHFVFKYSDDHGLSWSPKRRDVPQRIFQIDRDSADGGRLLYFWNVGRPFVHGGAACVPLHKVGGFGEGFFTRSEGVLLVSRNLPAETDPDRIAWETLPDGDVGLRAPEGGGPIAEEQSFVVLSDGSVYGVWRTVDGRPACSISRDGGHTWAAPRYQRYDDGRVMRHPRAANFVWKCSNGKYLYWFHNNGTRGYNHADPSRNPAWLCGGVEGDSPEGTTIRWSQPEIVLYADDPCVGMSYPDLVEQDGRYFITETQKSVARVHEIDPSLLEGLWGQFAGASPATEGLALDLPAAGTAICAECPMPALPAFTGRDYEGGSFGRKDLRTGFTIDLWVHLASLAPGQVLLDGRSAAGAGLCLRTTADRSMEIVLNDTGTESCWACDREALRPGALHHLAVIADAGPRIISFVVDGRLCDGGGRRPFGWGRFSPNLRHVSWAEVLRIAPALDGCIRRLRIYRRAIRTSEAIGNFRAAPP